MPYCPLHLVDDIISDISLNGTLTKCLSLDIFSVDNPSLLSLSCRFLTREMGGLTLGGLTLEGSCKTAQGEYRLGAAKPHLDMEEQLVREPYTCERLTQIRGGYRPLTGSYMALQFDFCNPEVRYGTTGLLVSAVLNLNGAVAL